MSRGECETPWQSSKFVQVCWTSKSTHNVDLIINGRRNTTIRFAHFSVKEYLISERIFYSTRTSSFFAICEADSQQFATMVCLIYLLSAVQDLAAIHEQCRLLRYSAEYWPDHLAATSAETREMLERNYAMQLFEFPFRTARWLAWHNPDSDKRTLGSPLYFSSFLGLAHVTA